MSDDLFFVKNVEIKKMFGASVKGWRNRLGISQEELAERADLHRTYVSDVERGARNLSLENITRLADALNISVASLFPAEFKPEKTNGDSRPVPNRNCVDILLVEDNADDAEITRLAFKQARFANRVAVVTDGAEALDYLFYRGKYSHRQPVENPQVILLDLNLPKVSGLEVLRQIKADKRTATIHAIILTGSENQCDMAKCQRLGADNYIVKPVDFQRLSQATPKLKLNWVLFKPADSELRNVRK